MGFSSANLRTTGAMCTISFNNKNGCPGLFMNMDSFSGDSGAEVITCSNPSNYVYLMYVKVSDLLKTRTLNKLSLASSGVRMALYHVSGEVARFNVPDYDPNGDSRSSK